MLCAILTSSRTQNALPVSHALLAQAAKELLPASCRPWLLQDPQKLRRCLAAECDDEDDEDDEDD
eukprot:CAMPEP_0168407252 /NCGR_PEP_ID=MMETSP0228-20121227/26066_1 /TAXON_ID=133427 /ORGANISM="Protoceratium reticulatum, Strain CCCM 535 (=CCMP 1889)" /LENGTH=64 /DNA_ID=CAMNT_0008420915 /DNA_START=18 /DNA_END=209 /DNA_ORIENTATION=-